MDHAWQALQLKAASSAKNVSNFNIFYQEFAQERRLFEARQKAKELRRLPESSISKLYDQVLIIHQNSESLINSKGQRNLDSQKLKCALDRGILFQELKLSKDNQLFGLNYSAVTKNLNIALGLSETADPTACLEATRLALEELEKTNTLGLISLFTHRSAMLELSNLNGSKADLMIGQDLLTLNEKCKTNSVCQRYPEVTAAIKTEVAKLTDELQNWLKKEQLFKRSNQKSDKHYQNISQMKKLITQLDGSRTTKCKIN